MISDLVKKIPLRLGDLVTPLFTTRCWIEADSLRPEDGVLENGDFAIVVEARLLDWAGEPVPMIRALTRFGLVWLEARQGRAQFFLLTL